MMRSLIIGLGVIVGFFATYAAAQTSVKPLPATTEHLPEVLNKLPPYPTTVSLADRDPTSREMTFQQIEDLNNALRFLDTGSVEQCGKDQKQPPAPCPLNREAQLVIAVAHDMLVLQPLDAEFKAAQNGLFMSFILVDKALTPEQRDAKFRDDLTKLYAERRTVPSLSYVHMADLKIGSSPTENRVPSSILASLSPVIADWSK